MPFSLNDKYILIHYHYIEDSNKDNSGMNPCSISEFEKHIKFLSENYVSAPIEKTFEAAKNNSGERYYSITFDDGLKDQYENAIPILKKYGAQATFFLITQTLEGALPSAHKLHIILSKISIFETIDLWNRFLKGRYPEHADTFFIPKDRRLVSNRRLYADIPTANIKEVFTAISPVIRDEFLSFLFEKYNFNEKELCEKLFLNPEEIKHIQKEGFSVGIHTHVHEPIGVLGQEMLAADFEKSKKWFKKLIGKEPILFSYPYGIIPNWGTSAVQKEGMTYAVTVLERAVSANDNPLLIPRYDMATLRNFLAKR
ncbi:MAG: polysaccharide deacetylase family protein [Parcubacteria group bacterium]|nr:polysaccharide deacetylase family protein [Parcubacteria group bacterium]